jgi:AcrR family transcriptional regulator
MTERADTKTRILDAAEKLFGIKGFEATSLRDITAEAQVNLAAVNYHFQSKDCLIDAVIARRIEPVNRKRMEMLEAAGPDAELEEILRAFLAPLLEQELEGVVPLLGRMLSEPNQFVERVYKKHLVPVSRRFNEALGRALPDLPAAERLWRLYFSVGVMTHLLSWARVLPELSGGLCQLGDRRALVERVVAYSAAGFRAPVPAAALREAAYLESGYQEHTLERNQ